MSLQAVPKIEEVLYHYQPLQVETYGPSVPELEQLGRLGYVHTFTVAPAGGSIYYLGALGFLRLLIFFNFLFL